MADLVVRCVPLDVTRALRRDVLRPHHTLEQVAAGEPATAFAVGVFDAGELVATGFVVPEGEPGAWRIRGMATAPGARGRGAGSAVLGALLAHAGERGAQRIWCSARTPAQAFYERGGMRVVSDLYDVPDSGPHYRMELALGSDGNGD
jgi:ribosomal protein S18 acetylase RimI-like enzyme